MKETHDLMLRVVLGNGANYLGLNVQKESFRIMLLRSDNPRSAIEKLLDLSRDTVRAVILEFEKDFHDNLDEMIAIGNLARGVWGWIHEIEEALKKECARIELIMKVVSPLSWLEGVIKTLQFELMTR